MYLFFFHCILAFIICPFYVKALGSETNIVVSDLQFSPPISFQPWNYDTRAGGISVSTVSVGSTSVFSYGSTPGESYALSFSTTENFVKDYVYSISILFSNYYSNYLDTKPSSDYVKYPISNPCDYLSIGYSYGSSDLGKANILSCSQSDFPYFITQTWQGNQNHDVYFAGNQIFTFTFIANESVFKDQFNTLTIHFKGRSNFLGYYLSSLGPYNENTTSALAQQIKDVEASINNNIDSMKEKQDETNDLISSDSDDTESKSCGIICKLKGIFTGIVELPSKLVTLLIDGLKGLFVPTNEQLQEIINDSKDLTENFGFIGESMAFFINIFTSLLGMVNAEGCINLPEFTIGATSLFDSHTFWQAQTVCLADNVVLSSNIETIRTVTSIVLVCLFISFASSKFFSILSKNDSGTTYDVSPDGDVQMTEWVRQNGNTIRQRR